MIKVQGPGKGLAPGKMQDLIGKQIYRDIPKDDYFLLEDLEGPCIFNIPNTFRSRWGLISRFSDANAIFEHKPRVIEFHMAENDFDLSFEPNGHQLLQLVIHSPEYIGDKILDLCSGSGSCGFRGIYSANNQFGEIHVTPFQRNPKGYRPSRRHEFEYEIKQNEVKKCTD